MMGQQKSEAQLFNYAINLEKRVRSNHPWKAQLSRCHAVAACTIRNRAFLGL